MNPSLSSAVSSRCKLIPLYYNLISPSSEPRGKPLLRMLLVNIRKILYCWHFLHLSELGSWKTELPQRVGPCRFQTILQLSWCCSGSFYVILEVSINYCCSISFGLNTILSWNLLCDTNQFITLNLTWDSQNACTMEVLVLVKISHKLSVSQVPIESSLLSETSGMMFFINSFSLMLLIFQASTRTVH